jgi:hypothetical protein
LNAPGALHVTNGDSAAGPLLETPLVERVLPWRDALHDGPVPAVADDALRRVRAEFLAEVGPAEAGAIRRRLEERDTVLAESADGEVVLSSVRRSRAVSRGSHHRELANHVTVAVEPLAIV